MHAESTGGQKQNKGERAAGLEVIHADPLLRNTGK